MRLSTVTLACAVAATAVVPLAGVALAADRDCKDFASQAQAQAALRPGDPERLDANNNGQACEEYAYSSTAGDSATPASDDQVRDKPSGGVEAGGGPIPSSSGVLPIALGAVAAGGVGAVAARRFARRG